jgi:hypothetical protein
MAETKHPIRNSVIASLTTAVITAIALAIVPGGWPWVLTKLRNAASVTFAWLNSGIVLPAWLVLLLSILSILVIVALALLGFALLRKGGARADAFTSAEFFGIKWRWKYGHHGIHTIVSFCPVCDLQVHPQNASSYRAIDWVAFRCDEGHWQSQDFQCSYEELEDRVRRKIQQQLRREFEASSEKTG